MLTHAGQAHLHIGGKAPPIDWDVNQAPFSTGYFVASDQPLGVQTNVVSRSGLLTWLPSGGSSYVVSASSFNGMKGATNPFTNNGISGTDLFGTMNPLVYAALGTFIFASMPPITIATAWGATACMFNFPFRIGMMGGTDSGVYKVVGYIYNGSVFVNAEQTIGASLPPQGFLAGVRCTGSGGNLIVNVNGVEGTPVPVGAANASNVSTVGFGFGFAGGSSTFMNWARLGFKAGNSARALAIESNWMAYDLTP